MRICTASLWCTRRLPAPSPSRSRRLTIGHAHVNDTAPQVSTVLQQTNMVSLRGGFRFINHGLAVPTSWLHAHDGAASVAGYPDPFGATGLPRFSPPLLSSAIRGSLPSRYVSGALAILGDSVGNIAAHSHSEGSGPLPRDEGTVLALPHGVLLGQLDGRIQFRANDMRTVTRDAINAPGLSGVEVDFGQMWMINRPLYAQRSVRPPS